MYKFIDWIGFACLMVFVIGGVVGWVLNIIKLVGAPDIQGMEVARIIGIFMAPLGAALG